MEQIGDVVFSPDGQNLAFVIKRPPSTNTMHKQDFLFDNDIADIWLVPALGGKPDNITNGAADGSGYWSPIWSPDGQRLAMLSTKGGNVRLWVWERSTNHLRRLTARGIDLDQRTVWISDTQLLCSVLPEGEKPLKMVVETQVANVAMREWPKAWQGRDTTANVLDSGTSTSYETRPQGQLLLIDVSTGTERAIADGNVIEILLSPDKAHIAVLKQIDVVRPDPDQPLPAPELRKKYGVVVTTTEAKPIVRNANEVPDVLPGSLRWSPDGTQLSLINRTPLSLNASPSVAISLPVVGSLIMRTVSPTAAPFHLSRYKLPDNSLRAMAEDTIEPIGDAPYSRPSLSWTVKNELLCLALPKRVTGKEKTPARADWWLVKESGSPQNLTAEMKFVPEQLIAEADGESFVGVAGGELWSISGKGVRNITEDFDPKITSIAWRPTQTTTIGPLTARLIVMVTNRAVSSPFLVDTTSGRLTHIAKPSAEAVLADYSQASGTAAFTARTRNGTYLWISRPALNQQRTILELNTFLRDIAARSLTPFQYRSSDGQELKGWLLLPDNYQEGTRYPLITVVYGGDTQEWRTASTLLQTTGQQNHALNWQLLAAHGYAVMFPSMPLKPMGEASDPLLELTKGVLPAIDKVIEMGIADPKRLGLMGQSYGGYAVYGLVTQTNRFQAAIAMGGMSDLISLYGAFDGRFRYDPFGQEQLTNQTHAEIRQFRMGTPPWKDTARYLRNSPIFYADRVETPLMIVHGDMDHIPIQQAEQFFMSLYRQNKRAKFVRYWGEGHVLRSPANIRDMWTCIYTWFDEYLVKPN